MRKRRRKKRIIAIVILISAVLIAAVAALCLTGLLSVSDNSKSAEENDTGVAYTVINGQSIIVDREGIVKEIAAETPKNLVLIEGILFEDPVLEEKLQCEDDEYFQYALDISEELQENNINAQKITISSEGEAEIYINKFTVRLGEESQTIEKIRDLKDLYGYVKDLCGILNMEDTNSVNGYIFKKTEDTSVSESETDAAQEGTEETLDGTEEYTDEYSEDNYEEYTDEYSEEYIDEYIEDYTEDEDWDYSDENTGEYWDETWDDQDGDYWEDEENEYTDEDYGEYSEEY